MKSNHMYTRKINPLLGLLGFMGFLGPILFYYFKEPFMLAFIAFFGFFSFYFEAKLSSTYKDETFVINEAKSDFITGKILFAAVIICLLISLKLYEITSPKTAFTFIVGAISFIWGQSFVLSNFLLLHYNPRHETNE